jgi:hypothetical protein
LNNYWGEIINWFIKLGNNHFSIIITDISTGYMNGGKVNNKNIPIILEFYECLIITMYGKSLITA